MKKHLFGVTLLMCLVITSDLVITSNLASAQTINDIQLYNPITGAPASPFNGMAVTVTGAVSVQKGTYNGGTWYIQGATGGINFFNPGVGPYNLGDIIELSGTVGAFGGEINISSSSTVFVSAGPAPTPISQTVTQLVGNYEMVGNLVSVIGNVAATLINGGNDTFWINSGTDTVEVFVDLTTGIDLTAVTVGTLFEVSGPFVTYNGKLEMKPRFQADLVANPGGDTLPIISNVGAANWVLQAGDPLDISATIIDDLGVVSANLHYTDSDGTVQGAWSSVPMTSTGGNIWSATIPGGHTGSQVDFYLDATDTGAQTVTSPGTAPITFLSAAVGFTSIYAINTVHPDSASQGSPMYGQFVNITGVVTAGTGNETGSLSKAVVQELNPNPFTNDYSYGGILMYEGTGTFPYFQGDEIAIGGQVSEFFGLTEMVPFNANAVNLIGFGTALPVAPVLSTRELADKSLLDGNGQLGERWESVWVKTFPGAVVDTLGFGQFLTSSTGARNDSLVVNPVSAVTYQPAIGDLVTIEGYITYSYGSYTLVPINDTAIIATGLSAVDDNTPTIQKAGGFRSIAPNPFNPMTKISFVVNRDDLVQLNVYNLRGEKVRTLVQDRLSANEYQFTFDGRNDSGEGLPSGAYFARLRIGKEVVQVRQMMLVK